MTNTPMTFEEWLVQEIADHHENNDKDMIKHLKDNVYLMQKAWQASQAQQASEIEALKHDLYSYMEASNGYVNEIMKQAQIIAELVEALEECLREHGGFTIKGQCERKAREAIAKVKGK